MSAETVPRAPARRAVGRELAIAIAVSVAVAVSIAVSISIAVADPDLMAWFQAEYPKHSDRKLDMGKSCMRFKKPEHVPLELIGKLCERMSAQDWITLYEREVKR